MNELEKKLLLTEDEYNYLLKYFGQGESIIKQVNYYFDTEDLSMNSDNVTCRIRMRETNCKGTLKRHFVDTDCSSETEIEIRNGVFDNSFIDMGLQLQGELITERHVILKNPICEVVLDKNDYLGHTDYELEIEYAPDHEKEANSKMQTITDVLLRHFPSLTQENITLRCKNTQSKSKRFFERKTKK